MCKLRVSDREFMISTSTSTVLCYTSSALCYAVLCCAVLCCAVLCCATVPNTHHDFLLALNGRHVTGEREEDLTHVSSVVKICKGLEQGHHSQQLPVS